MTISVLRTSDAWWVALDAHRAVPVETSATTTAELLDDVVTIHMALAEARSGTLAAEPSRAVSPDSRSSPRSPRRAGWSRR